MVTVEYPPGKAGPIHRHSADAFIYVLERTILMQLKGEKEVRVTAGRDLL